MRRCCALVLAAGFGWAAFASCSLDIAEVKPKTAQDAGTDGDDASTDGGSDAQSDADDAAVFVLPQGCVNPASFLAHCDPFTNDGCFGGLACDAVFDGGWRLECLSTSGITEGGTCSNATGPYCAPTFTCTGSPGVCVPFCCKASDCATSVCLPFDPKSGNLGFCSPPAADAG